MGESKTIEEATKNKDHLAMMRNPEWWPRRPVLPLRKRDDDTEADFPYRLGFLVEGKGPVVYIGCIFTGIADARLKFRSLEQVVASGWEVD